MIPRVEIQPLLLQEPRNLCHAQIPSIQTQTSVRYGVSVTWPSLCPNRSRLVKPNKPLDGTDADGKPRVESV